jgi:ABC-type nickel/cobalt efflux system permease component RcnA
MILALGFAVVLLAGIGGWRLWVMSQDIAVMDRDLGKLHEQLAQARQARTSMAQHNDHRHRQTEVAASQLQGELAALRHRVDGMEPWVRLWATADERE